jgi:hypothetical protein
MPSPPAVARPRAHAPAASRPVALLVAGRQPDAGEACHQSATVRFSWIAGRGGIRRPSTSGDPKIKAGFTSVRKQTYL